MGFFSNIFSNSNHELVPADTESPEYAEYILKKLVERHAPAVINFPGHAEQFVSLLLNVDSKNNVLTLDQMSPDEGHQLALKGKPFRVTLSDLGVAVIFNTKIQATGTEDGMDYYICELPKKVQYLQRREAFRVHTMGMNSVKVKFNIEEQEIADSYLHDISFGGAAIIVPNTDLSTEIQPGTIIGPIQFLLQDVGIVCKLEVKRCSYDHDTQKTLIAGQFFQVDRITARIINHGVVELERKERKRDSGDLF